MTTTNHWHISPVLSPLANDNLIEYPAILRQLLFNRGYGTEAEARAFLNAETLFDPSPFQLSGMEETVARLLVAIAKKEKIIIYGDYDVDGVTATVLLVQVISALGGDAQQYIPNRFEEGYGLNVEALTTLAKQGAGLVVSVDCGIRSPLEASHALALGVDLIITDHHEPFGEIPEAYAVINPKQPGDTYPEKYLAGVGIAYKIAQGLLQKVTDTPTIQQEDLLDLVALGTVADLAPLTGENRALVRAGLNQMRQTKRQGLFSLANVAGVSLAGVNAGNIAFTLGPRLNAAGRLESAEAAYDLLHTTDLITAGTLAQKLDVQNRERQVLTRKIQVDAEALALQEDAQAAILFAVHKEFNAGVVGLAAARLAEKYYRPAIVGQISEETTRCSCRSIREFHITEALDKCADLLVRHGGHAAAAGFTVRNENLEILKSRLMEIARTELAGRDLNPTLTADIEIPLSELRPELLKQLEAFQPTGYGNPEAVFVSRGVRATQARVVGKESQHLKLTFTDGRYTLDAIGFRMGDRMGMIPDKMDILYTFEANEYMGRTSLQINLKDLKATGTPD